jgi:uncharacterized protein
MPYIIDGHNLIPHISGLLLSEPDDEIRLIKLLQDFCRISRKKATVFFDRAAIGEAKKQTYGCVVAHFVSEGFSADRAIHAFLKRLGKNARNYMVVSSDHAVQDFAREFKAPFLPSADFVLLINKTLRKSVGKTSNRTDFQISSDEVDEWLCMFKNPKKK